MSASTLSVVMAVKDGERFLAEAIESLLGQSRPPDELIVVDGGSSDSSLEIARSYEPVTALEQLSTGIAGAWNEGVRAAAGDLIGFLDSDDRLRPSGLQLLCERMQQEPEIGLSIGRVRFFLEPGFEAPATLRPELLEGDHLGMLPGGTLTRRWVFEQVGGFDERYSIAADVDWYTRVKQAGVRIGNLSEVVLERRVHDSNTSHADLDRMNREFLRLFRATIKQRQAAE